MSYLDQLFSLEGKYAIVTGASRGLGNAIADARTYVPAPVCCWSAQITHVCTRPQRHFRRKDCGRHCTAVIWPTKLKLPICSQRIRDDPGHVDVLVNAAGITEGHAFFDYPNDLWERTLQVNLTAAFLLACGVAGMMAEQKSGSIINITSINAELGFPDNPAYVAAKGALKQLSKALAVDQLPSAFASIISVLVTSIPT